jgi:hypothetical protein
MTTDTINRSNNHLRGTEFDTPSDNPNSPIRRGIITIDGCVLRFVVYPEKVSAKGNRYNPVSLQYTPDCGCVLKAVRLGA